MPEYAHKSRRKSTRSSVKSLRVLMNGEMVGLWSVDRNGDQFRYEDSWLQSNLARPLSLSMPLRPSTEPYRDARVRSWFENLLPDSSDIRRRIQSRVHAASTNAFDLLSEIGNDCIGAVQLVPEESDALDVKCISGEPLSDSQVSDILKDAVGTALPGQTSDNFLRLSLAGAQEKTALLWHDGKWHRPTGATPTTHIIKLPLGRAGMEQADLSMSVENEWLCSRICAAFGLKTAHSEIQRFDDRLALVVERFDRKLAADGRWWLRVPQEDMCQATATPPELKYEADGGPGIPGILSLLLGSVNSADDRARFLKTQFLFWLLCAPDGHAKNFSVFLHANGRFELTPVYDVISAYPFTGRGSTQVAVQKINMAMAWRGENKHYRWKNIMPRHLNETARRTGLRLEGERMLDEFVADTDRAIDTVASELAPDFPDVVAEKVFSGMRKCASLIA